MNWSSFLSESSAATLEQVFFSQVVFKLFHSKCRAAVRGVLSRSERACTVWEPKLGFGKKIYNQCFVIIFGYYLVNCEVYMW